MKDNRAIEFLDKYGMSTRSINKDKIIGEFKRQMVAGLTGRRRSLAMLPTYINPNIEVVKNKSNIVIDAGGTNFRSCVAHFDDNNNCVISDLQTTKMPGVEEQLEAEEFFISLAKNVSYLVDKGTDLGFCFSYAVEMNEDIDGTVLRLSKEIKVRDLIGRTVGKGVLNALKCYSSTNRKQVLLNDTVATLLGGKGLTLDKKYDSYIGFIYGTGVNICYIEKNSNITYLSGLRGDEMIINIEAGDFNGFTKGEFDKLATASTMILDDYCFEKMTSGRYLGNLLYYAVMQLKKDNMFIADVDVSELFKDLKEVTPFAAGDSDCKLYNCFANDEDIKLAQDVVLLLIDRAALMCALALSAVIIFTGKGTNGSPVAIVCEGTTFNKLYSYKQRLTGYLDKILKKHGAKYEIVQGKELNLVGAALASLAKK